MTIDELIERLKNYRNTLGGEAPVRLMTQKDRPYENEIAGFASGEEINIIEDGKDEDVSDGGVVYIVEGLPNGFGSKRAWEVGHEAG